MTATYDKLVNISSLGEFLRLLEAQSGGGSSGGTIVLDTKTEILKNRTTTGTAGDVPETATRLLIDISLETGVSGARKYTLQLPLTNGATDSYWKTFDNIFAGNISTETTEAASIFVFNIQAKVTSSRQWQIVVATNPFTVISGSDPSWAYTNDRLKLYIERITAI